MKKTYTLSASILLFAHALFAQPAAKTTSISGSRLIAQTDLFAQAAVYVPADSSTFAYSGVRGGDWAHPLKFDQSNRFTCNSGGTYDLSSKELQTFDANNNMVTNVYQDFITTGSSWRNIEKYSYTYDANNNPLSYLDETWDTIAAAWVGVNRSTSEYDAANNLTSIIFQLSSSGTFVNQYRGLSTYDASHNRVTETSSFWISGAWQDYNNNTFTYTSSNKLATEISQSKTFGSLDWVNYNMQENTYDADDNLTSTLFSNWDSASGSWYMNYRVVSTFDAAGNLSTFTYQGYDNTAHVWLNQVRFIYSSYIDSVAQITITQYPSADTFVNYQRDSTTFNSFDQPISFYETSWIDNSWQASWGDAAHRYYYETYTTAVHNVSSNDCTVSIYPIPAKYMLHISATWNAPQAFTIQIIDMSGRVVSQWYMPESKTYEGNLTISNLSPGNYIMNITGTSAHSTQQIVISQ